MTVREFDRGTFSCPVGLGWMKFYIFYRFPISFVLLGIQIIAGASTTDWTQFGALDVYLYVFNLLYFAFMLVVYFKMKALTLTGYALNIALLICDAAIRGFNAAVKILTVRHTVAQLVLDIALFSAGLLLVWFLPNFLYFRKRRGLFGFQGKSDAPPASSAQWEGDYPGPLPGRYYQALEVSPSASRETIDAAYAALLRKYRHAGDADDGGERLNAIREAYEAITDALDRRDAAVFAPRPAEPPPPVREDRQGDPVPRLAFAALGVFLALYAGLVGLNICAFAQISGRLPADTIVAVCYDYATGFVYHIDGDCPQFREDQVVETPTFGEVVMDGTRRPCPHCASGLRPSESADQPSASAAATPAAAPPLIGLHGNI